MLGMPPLSLKSIIPALARATGLSPAAIYERQRALVRAGLLHGEAGWGPGSGVRATPESAALLLIAILATDVLAETAERTKLFFRLPSRAKPAVCSITGKKTFGAALTALLASKSMASSVHKIYAGRDSDEARIDCLGSGRSYFNSSYFGVRGPAKRRPMYVSAELVPFPLEPIANALHGEDTDAR